MNSTGASHAFPPCLPVTAPVFQAEGVFDGCGNVIARQMLTQLHNRIVLLRATSLSEPTRLRDSVKEIARILDAVTARDPAEAWSACVDHVNKAAAVAIRVLQREKGEKVNL